MLDANSGGYRIVEIRDIWCQALQEVLCILLLYGGDDRSCLADLEDVVDV